MVYNLSMKVKDVAREMEQRYPLNYAEKWDAPGLVVGSLEQDVDLAVFALDATLDVVRFAIAQKQEGEGAIIITHHPLFFRPVHKLGDDTFRGEIVNLMLQNRVSLYNAHTNADAARGGVGDALLMLAGVENVQPIAPRAQNPEEGLGRVGNLPEPMSLAEFARKLSQALPLPDVRVAGRLDQRVGKVALMPGAGDAMFDEVQRTGADVYVTSDLRHHPVLDAKYERDFSIIDVPHFSSEFPWVKQLYSEFSQQFDFRTALYETPTDPWDLKLG